MEKSAKTIGRAKFARLTSGQQHKLLAALARESEDDRDAFENRYTTMIAWAELDTYHPPAWLSWPEARLEYRYFHEARASGAKPVAAGHKLSWQARFPVTVVFDQVRAPFNLGSLLRLIDNFGFEGIVHASPGLNLNHPQLRKAARGAEQWIPVEYQADLPGWLEQQSRPVIGLELDQRAVSLNQWQPPPSCCLVLGNEQYGIAESLRELCDQLLAIPLFGYKNSMNLTHALAVVAAKITAKS
jgi:tRNA G18 (ribose-2'-O)-methylase SpoU